MNVLGKKLVKKHAAPGSCKNTVFIRICIEFTDGWMQLPIKSPILRHFFLNSFHKLLTWYPTPRKGGHWHSLIEIPNIDSNQEMDDGQKKLTRAPRSVSVWRHGSVLAPSVAGWGERYDLWWEVGGGIGGARRRRRRKRRRRRRMRGKSRSLLGGAGEREGA